MDQAEGSVRNAVGTVAPGCRADPARSEPLNRSNSTRNGSEREPFLLSLPFALIYSSTLTGIKQRGANPMRALRLFSLISLQALTCVALGQQPASPAVPGSAEQPSPAAQSSRNDPCRQGWVAPRRDPHSPGSVAAVEIADGQVPPAERDGNFVLGPTHLPAPETSPRDGVPQGTLYEFTMNSADSKYYPGIARDQRHLRHARPNRSR